VFINNASYVFPSYILNRIPQNCLLANQDIITVCLDYFWRSYYTLSHRIFNQSIWT